MISYDPMVAPNPKEWLAMDEGERLLLVEQYHRRKKLRMPNVRAHAAFHVIVENQNAMGDELPVAAKLRQLRREGLVRHDAVHTIASVVARMQYYLLKRELEGDPNLWYNRELQRLTKKSWEESNEDDEK